MNIFEGVTLNQWPFIGPLIILIMTMLGTAVIYSILFKWLPKKLYNLFLGPAALVGFYIWAFPMNLGFHEFFK
ncbi:hypothetical protein ACTHO0_24775 [Cytobacillus praedii]|uniref:hypothetical protein n=1 Tax=Cytobacillus praedii TaxID=1742358 RepID=UPI003F7FE5B7